MRDPEILASHLEDAAHYPGGHAEALALPDSEAAVADVLRTSRAVLPIGAQSSLTGGATPKGDVLLSLSRFVEIEAAGHGCVRAGAGVTLTRLDEALSHENGYYPPVPTFTGAFVGGVVATNAAGAATFKYGSTRDWVQAITVVLAEGDVLDIERGQTRAHPDGYFDIELRDRRVRVPVPRYSMPQVAKLSAGYFAAPGMDLIDLFIGAEGTLGVVTSATLRTVSPRPAWCLALVPCPDRSTAIRFARRLRDEARRTWREHDARGIDVAAVEYMDARSLDLLREDGADRKAGVTLRPETRGALLVTLELPAGTTAGDAYEAISSPAAAGGAAPLASFSAMLQSADLLDDVEIAVPHDRGRMQQLLELREAVPAGVNARVGRAKAQDARIEKTAGDFVVPFDALEEMFASYDQEFARRGLDFAVWGHLSDGNVHPNVIPRAFADVTAGKEALRACAHAVARLGGAPLAEHGVGRNPLKQLLLRELYGDEGVAEMKAVKRALDPEWKLAPGVLFTR